MKAALMIISMLSCLMAGAGNKEYTLNQSVKQNEILFFNMATGEVATAVLWLWGGVKTISSFSLWLGIWYSYNAPAVFYITSNTNWPDGIYERNCIIVNNHTCYFRCNYLA